MDEFFLHDIVLSLPFGGRAYGTARRLFEFRISGRYCGQYPLSFVNPTVLSFLSRTNIRLLCEWSQRRRPKNHPAYSERGATGVLPWRYMAAFGRAGTKAGGAIRSA
jgi:hypothetical protein